MSIKEEKMPIDVVFTMPMSIERINLLFLFLWTCDCQKQQSTGVLDKRYSEVLTLDPHNSMKIQKMFSLECGFFCTLIPFTDIFLIPRPWGNWYKNFCLNMNLRKDFWLPISWPNRYNFITTNVQHFRRDHRILERFDQSLHPWVRWFC